MTRALVTGGSGFIGSHLTDLLLERGDEVTIFDNFSTGRAFHISHAAARGARVITGDICNRAALEAALAGQDVVYHFAAHTDTVRSNQDRSADFHNGTMATNLLLDAMHRAGVRDIVLPSSQLVFGTSRERAYTEDCGPLRPITLYGASKLACEGLASVYSASFEFRATVLRLTNIVGPRLRGGIVVDFVDKLRATPRRLEILGDGQQTRSYVDVEDCVSAVVQCHALSKPGRLAVFHVANHDAISAVEIARIVVEELSGGQSVDIVFTGGTRGWSGDVPSLMLDNSRLCAAGWRPRLSSREAVRRAVHAILEARG